MDTSIVPLLFGTFAIAIAGTWMELRASLEPAQCPECPHCRARAEQRRLDEMARERSQAELQSTYARRMGLHDENERRGRRD